MTHEQLDQLCINTIRTLSMDAIQQANSGHPGTPMALAPVAYCLWQRFLRFDPQDPIWPDRDRFVLSVGHASMLLYSLLHLTGVKAVSKDYETLGELSVPLDAYQTVPSIWEPLPRIGGLLLLSGLKHLFVVLEKFYYPNTVCLCTLPVSDDHLSGITRVPLPSADH